MQAIFNLIKRLLPGKALKKIRPIGHGFLAYVGAAMYGFPADKMIIVGITGTAGKSTAAQMLSKILNASGQKTGYATTAGFFDGSKERVNQHGMSMAGRFLLQSQLFEMHANGCKVAIVEATSEGLAQNRHLGINFDVALLTNLDKAHIEAHGSFENYKKAKGRLFVALSRGRRKKFFKKKILGLNLDTLQDNYFLDFQADFKFAVLQRDPEPEMVERKLARVFYVWQVQTSGPNSIFKINDQDFVLHLPGKFNVLNAALAAGCAEILGTPLSQSAAVLQEFSGVSGRLQKIANNKGFQIYLDYAPEPIGMRAVLETLKHLPHRKIIHVFGSTGGHRDASKRAEFGKISARFSDIIVITNDDVYNSDPKAIAQDILKGAEQVHGSERKYTELRTILDRREAIKIALRLAKPDDIVLITGKGSEQFLVLPGNKRIAWDERKVIEECLQNEGARV